LSRVVGDLPLAGLPHLLLVSTLRQGPLLYLNELGFLHPLILSDLLLHVLNHNCDGSRLHLDIILDNLFHPGDWKRWSFIDREVREWIPPLFTRLLILCGFSGKMYYPMLPVASLTPHIIIITLPHGDPLHFEGSVKLCNIHRLDGLVQMLRNNIWGCQFRTLLV
jgi:hypothetical protein